MQLGPYEIVTAIGAGGMGEVYRARDTRLGRDVVIRTLPQHLTENLPELDLGRTFSTDKQVRNQHRAFIGCSGTFERKHSDNDGDFASAEIAKHTA